MTPISFKKITACNGDKTTFLCLQQSIPLLQRYYPLGFKKEVLNQDNADCMFFIQKEGVTIGLIDYEINDQTALIHRIVVGAGSKKEESLLVKEAVELLLKTDFKKDAKSVCITTDAEPGIHHFHLIWMYYNLGFVEVTTVSARSSADYLDYRLVKRAPS